MKKIILYMFNIIFFLSFILVIFINFMYKYKYQYNISIIIAVLFFLLISLLIMHILKKEKKSININRFFVLNLILIIILQCISAIAFANYPKSDLGIVYNIANSNKDISNNGYLNIHPNNIAITVLLRLIIKSTSSILKNGYIASMAFNIIMIDIAIIFTFLIAKEILSKKHTIMLMLFLTITNPIYMYVTYFYTDTLSMLFPVAILYMYILFNKNREKKSKYIYLIIIALLSTIGMYIKMTVLIMTIAIIIYELLLRDKGKLKYACIIPIFILIFHTIFYNTVAYMNIINKEKIEQKALPFQYYLLLGLEYPGSLNSLEDYVISTGTDGRENKVKVINNVIEKKINLKKEKDWKSLINKKLTYTWADGTYFIMEKLTTKMYNKHPLQVILKYGKYHKQFLYITDIIHFSMIILICISGLLFRKNKKDGIEIMKISIFGLFLYLLISETRSRYLVNYIPIMVLLESYSIYHIYFIIRKGYRKISKSISNIINKLYKKEV